MIELFEINCFYLQHFTLDRAIGLMSRVFANGIGDLRSILDRVILMTQKKYDATLFNTQHYKVRNKGKVEQSKKWSNAFPYHLGVVATEKGRPRRRSPNLLYI